MTNLVGNAIKFSNKGDTVTVSVSEENGSVRDFKKSREDRKWNKVLLVRVEDIGKGIHPEIMPRLFQEIHVKVGERYEGLGLFISKNIVGSPRRGNMGRHPKIEKRGSLFVYDLDRITHYLSTFRCPVVGKKAGLLLF